MSIFILYSIKQKQKKSLWIFQIFFRVYFACLSVCLFVSNKRQNSWTDPAQICDPRESLWMIEFQKLASNKIRVLNILKIHETLFIKSVKFLVICFVLFYIVNKENMFTIEIEDIRFAP